MKELYSDNLSKVSGAMDELWQEDMNLKIPLSKVWQRNIQFANGNQLFTNNGMIAGSMTNNQPLINQGVDARQQIYTTNEIDPIMRTMVSFLTRSKPAAEVFPADQTEQSRRVAELAENVHEAKYLIDNEYINSKVAAHWTLATGSAIRKDYWDMSLGHQAEMPVFDELGNEVIDPETGDVQLQRIRTGTNQVKITNPFTISVDNSVTDQNDLPWVCESYIMPLDWAKDSYDQNKPGYTGKAKDITEDYAVGSVLNTLEDLKFAVPNSFSTTKPSFKGKCLIQEIYTKPTDEFPRGRLIVRAGGQIVYIADPKMGSPYFMPYEPIMWHPYSFMFYEPFIGRFWGKSMVEQLIPLQMRINEINGAILENANTIAKPNILAEENQFRRGILNGRGANIYTYRRSPSGAKPEILQGAALPAQFFKEKQDLIEAMVRIVGTNFVMQGQPPSGVSAASAIEQLLENANTQHSDFINTWEEFHSQGFTKKLRIIRNFNKFPNPVVVDAIRQLAKDALDVDIESFVGEDLSEGVTVRIEPGSMIPKSAKVRRENLKGMIESGLMGPAVAEDSPRGAKMREEICERFGEEPIETDDVIEVKKAKWENEKMLRGEPAEVSEFDNAQIHKACHIAQIQDPKFLEKAKPEQLEAIKAHIAEHDEMEALKAEQAMQQQAQQMPPGAPGMMPPGMPPPGMGGPQPPVSPDQIGA